MPEPIDAPIEELDDTNPDPDAVEVPEPYGEEWEPEDVERALWIDTTPLEDF